mmetsp:Transcript_17899/g.27678  ORF Transcript_17899/g.27678 Transcript_17899/m.27678 type:complete len:105 (-) Transcript_17899:25-339(-)
MMQDIIEQISPVEICRLGGAGNKVNRIALDEVDSYVQPRSGLSFWDLCAPEAIVRGMGGRCSDFQNKKLIYDQEKQGNGTTLPAFFIGKSLNMYKRLAKQLPKL